MDLVRRLFFGAITAFALVFFASCGELLVRVTDDNTNITNMREQTLKVMPPSQIPISLALPGEWYWEEIPFYSFEADGTGLINAGEVFEPIRWWSRGGVLFICTTPGFCRGNCLSPDSWYYEISDEGLTLTGTNEPDLVFSYTQIAKPLQ